MSLDGLRELTGSIPFSYVVAVLSASVALFTVSATLSKLAADHLTALPLGEGVLAARVRETLRKQVNTQRRHMVGYSVLWGCAGAISGAFAYVAYRTSSPTGGIAWVGAAAFSGVVAVGSVIRSWIAWRRSDESRETLRREIEQAKWAARERSLLTESLAELSRLPSEPTPPVTLA